MIKFKVELDSHLKDEVTNIAWVTKRKVTNPNSQSFIGLKFHKITPRIKETVIKNILDNSHCR